MKTLQQILENLNDEQKQLLADTINYGSWGDAEVTFGEVEDFGYGYITDEAYRGGHFERKSLSRKFQSLYKALEMKGSRYFKTNDGMSWMYDWWADGSGSVLFIRKGLYNEFDDWAEQYK